MAANFVVLHLGCVCCTREAELRSLHVQVQLSFLQVGLCTKFRGGGLLQRGVWWKHWHRESLKQAGAMYLKLALEFITQQFTKSC